MTAPLDSLTVLTTFGPLATKTVGRGLDGQPAVVKGYDDACHFAVMALPLDGFPALAAHLGRLEGAPRSFVIRGAPLPGIDHRRCRRLVHAKRLRDGTAHPPTFSPHARRWLALDFDGVPVPPGLAWPGDPDGAADHLRRLLPPAFHDASVFYQLTASAGIKLGLRLRLWFWLDRALSDAEATRWLSRAPVDVGPLRTVQPNYTARPVFRGMADFLPRRSGVLAGRSDTVRVGDVPPPAPAPTMTPTARPSVHGPAYAAGALRRVADEVATAPPGGGSAGSAPGRHHALFTGALRLGRFVERGDLSPAEVMTTLVWAGRRARLDDPDAELRRTIANGLHAGVARAGR